MHKRRPCFADCLQNRCSRKFSKILRKITVLERRRSREITAAWKCQQTSTLVIARWAENWLFEIAIMLMKLTNWQKISMIDSSILISSQSMLSLALWELPRIFMFVWFIICLPKWKVQIYNSAIGTSYLEQ